MKWNSSLLKQTVIPQFLVLGTGKYQNILSTPEYMLGSKEDTENESMQKCTATHFSEGMYAKAV